MDITKKRAGRVFISTLLALILVFSCAACTSSEIENKDYGEDFTTLPLTDHGYSMEEVRIEIPGLTEEYNLLLVADLHIIELDNDVDKNEKANVKNRIKAFSADGGRTTGKELWSTMPDYLDACNADAILFAGDMVDFSSSANNKILYEGLQKIDTPYMLVKADHDLNPFYLNMDGIEKYNEYQDKIGSNEPIWYVDLGQVVILCVNNSTDSLPDIGMDTLNEVRAIGKPIVILTHVPYNSVVDSSLMEESVKELGGRNLTWSGYNNTSYFPKTDAQWELMGMVYYENSPIVDVLSGHLHFSWDGMITDEVHQHVFSPAFEKKIGHIVICGTK